MAPATLASSPVRCSLRAEQRARRSSAAPLAASPAQAAQQQLSQRVDLVFHPVHRLALTGARPALGRRSAWVQASAASAVPAPAGEPSGCGGTANPYPRRRSRAVTTSARSVAPWAAAFKRFPQLETAVYFAFWCASHAGEGKRVSCEADRDPTACTLLVQVPAERALQHFEQANLQYFSVPLVRGFIRGRRQAQPCKVRSQRPDGCHGRFVSCVHLAVGLLVMSVFWVTKVVPFQKPDKAFLKDVTLPSFLHAFGYAH
jgi:hypothetical protein